MYDMVNRTRVEGGGYSKHDLITIHDMINRRVVMTLYTPEYLLFDA